MDNMSCNRGQPVLKKMKKKPAKDELDRIKQAEKKKRRLEKALATSAAIRAELEKKKQKKKEEQQRLDDEGAAIAESVALHVLLGEDSDDTCNIMLKHDQGFNPWDSAANVRLLMGRQRATHPYQESTKYSLEGIGYLSNTYGSGYELSRYGNGDCSFSSPPYERNIYPPYYEEQGWGIADFSAGLIAAQAVSSLRLDEDDDEHTFLLDRMLRG